ncbi:MAG: N-6 DNA methylase [Clostridiales bacterium]|nr:N-6 DNA methylase [Clostridiales bacterium]
MIDSALKRLSEKQYLAIIKSDEYKELLAKMSSQIVHNSKSAPNEATIESYFDCELFHFFKMVFEPIGYKYNPVKESSIATRRHITKGRADTAVGALVIEFKQPSKLKTIKHQKAALEQIQEYLDGVDNENDTTMIGFVTDGIKGCFVIKCEGGTTVETYRNIDWTTLDRLIQNIVSLGQTALNSRNLVDNFCNPPHNNGIAFDLLNSLYSTLSNMTPKTSMLFNEWKELFNLAHDDISKQQAIIDRRSSLESLLKVQFSGANAEYKALFALQTAYAIIVKIVAYRVVSYARYKRSLYDFETLRHLPADALRAQLSALEEGSIFREYGITNLLEGDFFSWYSSPDQWSLEIANSISKVFDVLSQYSNKAVLNKVERSKDFFKALYETMMPAAVRHSLGEYYTKKWLAQHVVDEAVMMVNIEYWRGLDPCCGSGTFVTVMIDKVLHQLGNESDESKLRHVLDRVKGMDLNPVAVLTARVNYFINISHLIRDDEELEIPVYLGDSSYVPRKVIFDGIRCLEYSISTLKKPIEIIVPESMVSDSLAFSKSMTTMELHIKNLDSESAFNILISLVDENDLTEKIVERLQLLSVELVELERNNWDGIWARIITNFLTTANIGRFDVIVGNPPWVDWKSLPSGYRDRIKSLCISRKLFSGDKLTGGINLNICALIANVAAENWLKEEGVLAFLMPEPLVYQPSYEGFRNLYMSNDSRLFFRKFTNWTKAGHPVLANLK